MPTRPTPLRLDQRPVLLVSPHLDDVILSCEAFVGRDEPLDVLTVCTGRPASPVVRDWDQRSGFRDSDEAMDVRLREDEEAFAGTPHRRHLLGLLDQQYLDGERPGTDAAALVAWVDRWRSGTGGTVLLPTATGALPWVPGPARPLAVRAARTVARVGLRAARGVLARLQGPRAPRDEVVVGPGVNGDHRWVRDTLLEHLLAQGAEVGLYEDVPYVYGRPGQAEVDLLVARHGLVADEQRVPVDRVAKARRVAAYRSQVPLLVDKPLPLDDPAGLPRDEAYWLVRRARR